MQKILLFLFGLLLFNTSIKITQASQETPIKINEPKIIIEEKTIDVIHINRISFYNPVSWQTDSTPEVSSCGPNKINQVALSRDLFFNEQGEKYLCGTKVKIITDDGEVFNDYVIWDTMNPRFTNTVDIMLPHDDHEVAFDKGITSGVLIIED